MEIPRELVAASATPLILSILNHEDSYGYAIIAEVRRLSGGQMEWADGMLYPILHRLEKKGQIESYWGKSEGGRKRKYYRLKKSGQIELNIQVKNWSAMHQMLMGLQGGKVCFP